MVAALEENEHSATFGWDLSSAADATGLDDPAACSIAPMHSLSPHHPDAFVGRERRDGDGADGGGGFPWADLIPTGVSWNASGYSLAVSYGRFDVTGWCDSPGALCVWNLRRADVDPGRPHVVMETSSCLQCVAFHPQKPNVVAAGSLDGEVMVWDLAIDTDAAGVPAKGVPTGVADGVPRSGGGKGSAVGDALVGKSEVSDASHREPVTCVGWMRNPEAVTTVTTAGVGGGHDDGTYELVSAGSDGRVLVWDLSDVSQGPVYGYELAAVNEASGAMTTWGASCAAFSEPFRSRFGAAGVGSRSNGATTTHVEPGSFYAGSDGGPVFRCALRHSRVTRREFRDRLKDSGVAPPMYSPIKQTHDGHVGATHAVCVNPHDQRVFATCGGDGALRVYTRYVRSGVVTATSAPGALFAVTWSPTRPALIACGGVGGRVCLYDLTATGGEDVQPTEQFRACDAGTDVQAIAFNPALPEYLATADARFVRVWELGAGLTTERAGERRVIDAIAGAETAAEAAAALDAAKASRR